MKLLKMRKLFLVAMACSFLSCKGQIKKSGADEKTKDPVTVIQEKERKSAEKQYDYLGELVSNILFKVKTNNTKDFEDGFIPWASIEKAKEDIPKLHNKGEVVIKDTLVKIVIDYPLTNQYEFILRSQKGFTRQQLLEEISDAYYKIYDEEEKTATIKTIPIDKRTTIANRNQTNGRYDIWGHDIGDLVLTEILVYKGTSGEIILILNIDS